MATMKTPFKENGVVTAASFFSAHGGGGGAAPHEPRKSRRAWAVTIISNMLAAPWSGAIQPSWESVPFMPPARLLKRAGLAVKDIGVWELNEAFGSQALACLRELGIAQNAPFDNVNVWGGAMALGHPLGESGCRIIVTLNNIMKTDFKEAKYGVAMLCGGFGNGNASLWQRVDK